MTLNEAIEKYEELAEEVKDVFANQSLEYFKVAQWLKELRDFRGTDPNFPRIDVTSKLTKGR